MAECHKVPRLCQAVDLAGNTAEQVRVDDQASVLKDRFLDKPAEALRRFGATVLSGKQILGRLAFKNRPRLRQIKVDKDCDIGWQQIIECLVVLDLLGRDMNVNLPFPARSHRAQVSLKMQR